MVFAALAVTRWLERTTGWPVKKLVKTLRRYHTIQIQVGDKVVTAADPLPDDALTALTKIQTAAAAH